MTDSVAQSDGTKPDVRNRLAGAPDAVAAGAEGKPGAAQEPSPVGKSVRSIAVVGMAPAAIQELDRLDDDTEIWSLNVGPLAFVGDRWTRHYEVHDFDWLKEREGQNMPAYVEWLQQDHGKPIYMPVVDSRVPSSVPYPLIDVVKRFGRFMPDGRPNIYFESTVDWMLVHAIYELAEAAAAAERPLDGHIHLFGVDMGMKLEYSHQRKSIEHWLGVALGLGIQITVPQTSDILQCAFPYGLETYEPRAKKLQQRRQELIMQRNQASEAERNARDQKLAIKGALDDLDYIIQGRY